MRNNAMYFITGSLVFCIMVFSCLLPSSSLAVVRYVPADYPTIQSAIDASSDGDEVIVSPGTYVENIHFKGKNIVLRSIDPTSPTLVASTIIDGNQAGSVVTFSGTESSNCVLSGFTITNGYAEYGGGICGNTDIYNFTQATIQNNIITGNTAWNYGGGVCGCYGTIQNNTISGNSAKYDGGGLHRCDGTIQNNTISGNSAKYDGGGLAGCYGTIQNNTISGNSASGSGGGLAWCWGTIQNNTINGNSASGKGGGLYDCDGTIHNNTISENSASRYGGGLAWCDGSIQNNTISNNSAESGGGLAWCGGTIQNNTISGNSAESGGGLYDCGGTIQNNTISGNSSKYGGGLSYCNGTIQNNIIHGNSASQFGGGLAKCDGTIQNNTISGNSAEYDGGGLANCDGTIRNCIIWQNTVPQGSQLYNCSTPYYSCIQDWDGGGIGNINSDPLFVNPGSGDYHLQAGSPCIDAGVNCYWRVWPQWDRDGNCRLQGARVDMGCYEYGSTIDRDGDLLSDAEEDLRGTNPLEADSDGDELKDGLEVLRGSNPLVFTPAGQLNVPSDLSTIQLALAVSKTGDEIIVSPGEYYENIEFCGADVILRSNDPTNQSIVQSTIINGSGVDSVVKFSGRESTECILSGFTITNGYAVHGGGILGGGCYAAIQNNIITENTASESGGGLAWCDGTIQNNIISGNTAVVCGGGLAGCDGAIQNNTISSNSVFWYGGGLAWCGGTIQNNTISGNSASRYGGGLYCCNGTIQNNIISGNSASRYGGGLLWCNGTIQNNTIWHNIATSTGGGLCNCNGTVLNCIIWANEAPGGGAQLFYTSPTITLTYYSCIQDWSEGGTGNISQNPKLADPENGDFHLLADSPCIDAGCLISDLMIDFEGDPRGYNGTSEPRGDGSDYDIGADEYIGIMPTPTPTPALPNFSFEENEEGWTFSGKILPFDEAAGNWESGRLNLTALGSTNCFGYWFSPDVAVEDGKFYRARWTVGSTATDPDKTVGFRLRINQRGSWAGWDRVVNSYLGQAPSAGNPKTYDLYFDPIVTGVNNDHLVIFSFDLTSFDINDDPNSSLYLDELIVEEVSSLIPG